MPSNIRRMFQSSISSPGRSEELRFSFRLHIADLRAGLWQEGVTNFPINFSVAGMILRLQESLGWSLGCSRRRMFCILLNWCPFWRRVWYLFSHLPNFTPNKEQNLFLVLLCQESLSEFFFKLVM